MNNNRDLFTGNLTAEPELNYSPKGTAVVSTSIANDESYGCAGSGVGRISYASCEFTGKHCGYHDRDHYDHDRYYREGQSDGNYYRSDRPSIRRSTCIFEQMPVSELAVMVQGCRQLQKRRASVKKRMAGIMAKTPQPAQLL
jgi:hypothetical protein